MAQVIKIKRSSTTASPVSLSAGEIAYSSNSKKFFIGAPGSGTVTTIGGDLYVEMLDHAAGTLTASSAIVVDSSSKIDQLKTGNIVITGSTDTISTASSADLTIAPSGNLIITHGGTVDLDAQATSLTIPDNEAAALDINEGGTSYLKFVTTNGGELVDFGKNVLFGNDAHVLSFGVDSDVTLTHVADTGLLLNGASKFQFRDDALTIGSSADGQLDIDADTEVEITTGTFDVNATTTDFSGTVNTVGNLTVNTDKFTVSAGEGNTSISGTLGVTNAATFSSSVDITGALTANGAVTLGDNAGDAITVTGTATFSQSADFDAGFTVASSQTVNFGGNRLTNIGTPTQATDATTKAYVDSVKQALDIKDSVRVATTANLSATYDNGTGGVGATLTADSNGAISVDGVTLSSGDRVLVKDQSTGTQNGIYSVTTVGDAGTAFVLTRVTDADSSAEVTGGLFTFTEEGSTNGDAGFVLTNITGSATLGSDTLTFTQFSGAGQVTAGDGLAKTGNTLSVNVDDTSLEIVADTLQIKGLDDAIAEGDLIFGANTGGSFTTLAIGTYDSTNSVGQMLQVGNNGTITWTNTLDGGTF